MESFTKRRLVNASRHPEEITNLYPNLQGTLHTLHSSTPDNDVTTYNIFVTKEQLLLCLVEVSKLACKKIKNINIIIQSIIANAIKF